MKKLLFLLLTLLLISCSGSLTGPYNICVAKIQYHTSSNCDDSSKEGIAFSPLEISGIITNIESILSETEFGECVLVNLGGVFMETENDYPDNKKLWEVYIVNDTDKSWRSIGENCIY